MAVADMLIINAKVLTVDKDFSIKQAIAVKDGLIIDVGDTENIKKLAGPQTKVIDLEGKTILPGAHDAHMHATLVGILMDPSFFNLFYPNIKSLKELKEKLAERVKKTPPGTWICGLGWNTAMMEEFAGNLLAPITRYDLDEVSPDHPVFLIHFSCNQLVANSKAIELAGVTKDTPMKGVIKDSQTGEPTGMFEGFPAQVLIGKYAPLPLAEDIKQYIKLCQEELNRNGYTSHTDAGLGVGADHLLAGLWGSVAIDAYQQMSKNKELTCRVSIGLFPFIDSIHSYENMLEGFEKTDLSKHNDDPNWIRYWLKIRADGMPLNYTIWMDKDQKCGHHGSSTFPGGTDGEQYEDFLKTIKYLHKKGWQIGVHGMGELTVTKSIDAFVAAMEESPDNNPRHYIIHGELITPEQAKVCAKYNIGLSMQPTNDAILYAIYDAMYTWEGGAIPETMAPFKMLFDSGVNVAGGSDAPVSMPNWRESVQAAVTRRSLLNGQIYGAENAISVEDGIRMFTINGAIQEHAEKYRGSIEIGKVADFQVLGQDILTVDKEMIGQIPVVMTIVDGKIVYSA